MIECNHSMLWFRQNGVPIDQYMIWSRHECGWWSVGTRHHMNSAVVLTQIPQQTSPVRQARWLTNGCSDARAVSLFRAVQHQVTWTQWACATCTRDSGIVFYLQVPGASGVGGHWCRRRHRAAAQCVWVCESMSACVSVCGRVSVWVCECVSVSVSVCECVCCLFQWHLIKASSLKTFQF